MKKATLISTGITVYIHEGAMPKMRYNNGKLVVSKQPNSIYTFCVNESDLIVSNV